MRCCKHCGVELTASNWALNHGRQCSPCRSRRQTISPGDPRYEARQVYLRQYYLKNKDKWRKNQIRYWTEHSTVLAMRRERYATDPEYRAQVKAYSAKRRGAMSMTKIDRLTGAQWLEILEYFGNACAYCHRDDVPMTQDHVVPVSGGGAHTADNVVPACLSCNSRKSNRGILCMVEAA